jgi:thymidylate synthase ThyX
MNINWTKQETRFIGLAHHKPDIAMAQIEYAGRLAWKSERREGDTAESFVKRIAGYGHTSVLEHSNIVIEFPSSAMFVERYFTSKYLHVQSRTNGLYTSVSGNLRAWMDSYPNIHEFRVLLHELYPTLFPVDATDPPLYRSAFGCRAVPINEQEGEEQLLMFHIITDRGITHEIVRHRTLQFTQESTRYVNYGKKGFQFIVPSEAFDDAPGGLLYAKLLEKAANQAIENYNDALRLGFKPQIARDVLTNFLKTEIIVSGRPSAFRHFYALRSPSGAHPRIREIALTMADSLIDLGHLRKDKNCLFSTTQETTDGGSQEA